MKTLVILLLTCLLGLLVQPLLPHRAVAGQRAAAHDCCGKEKSADAEKGGCHKDAEDTKGCCGDEGCNPFFTQCPSCAAVALPARAAELAARLGDVREVRRYPVFRADALSTYLAEMLRPPQVV